MCDNKVKHKIRAIKDKNEQRSLKKCEMLNKHKQDQNGVENYNKI